jgi:diadenylate cyclase
MPQAIQSILDQVRLSTIVDIGITAVLIYWLFLLIRGTQAVRLVIGVSVLLGVYAAARLFNLQLLRQILETGAIVGVFALVVVFQPELRRALERIGRVGSVAWIFSPVGERTAEHVAAEIARAATELASQNHGALIVIERETGLEETAESGVMLHADLSADLLVTIFMPRTALHDGAVIVRGEQVVAAGALLPLAETSVQSERLGTRHRAALGIAEATDAVVVVVSEETGQVSLVERSRIRRNLNEQQLARAVAALLRPAGGGRSLVERGTGAVRSVAVARPSARRVAGLGHVSGPARVGEPGLSTQVGPAVDEGAATPAAEPPSPQEAPIVAEAQGQPGSTAAADDGATPSPRSSADRHGSEPGPARPAPARR